MTQEGEALDMLSANDCSVVICAHDSGRWPDLVAAVDSVLAQDPPPLEVVVVIDHNDALLQRAERDLVGVTVVASSGLRGASGSRDSGVARTKGELIAFLDDDAVASPRWLAELLEAFRDPAVLGAGGAVEPSWAGDTPAWFTPEFAWAVGGTRGVYPDRLHAVRNVWTLNMAVRRDVFDAVDGFRSGFGKVGSHSRPEDTDLCIRTGQRFPDGRWLFTPGALVWHSVPSSRSGWRYYTRRCFLEGTGKAQLAALVGNSDGLSAERRHALRALPRALARELAAAGRGDRDAAVRAGAVVLGAASTAGGYAWGRLAGLRGGRRADRGGAQAAGDPPAEPARGRARIVDLELTDEPPKLADVDDAGLVHRRALLLARLHGRPVGTVEVELPPGGLAPGDYDQALWAAVGAAASDHLRADGLGAVTSVAEVRRGANHAPPCAERRRRQLASAPSASVVVCTRNRAEQLEVCLDTLLALRYPRLEILIVDNAPHDDSTERVVRGYADDRLRYVREPRPGLSWARNRGLLEARGDVVAFTDDDVRVDADWLAALCAGFAEADDVACVTGVVLPAELVTQAQDWFEQFGGHSKGRGSNRQLVRPEQSAQHPLYPVPAYGAGASMAFDRDTLIALGGFEPALGAGTGTAGAEDTAMFSHLLLAGHALLYEPAAVVWHEHRRDEAGLRTQLRGYGVGLTAYYSWCLHRHPLAALSLLRMLPTALRYLTSQDSQRCAVRQDDYPSALDGLQRRGMLLGPLAYVRARRQVRRLQAEHGRLDVGPGRAVRR